MLGLSKHYQCLYCRQDREDTWCRSDLMPTCDLHNLHHLQPKLKSHYAGVVNVVIGQSFLQTLRLETTLHPYRWAVGAIIDKVRGCSSPNSKIPRRGSRRRFRRAPLRSREFDPRLRRWPPTSMQVAILAASVKPMMPCVPFYRRLFTSITSSAHSQGA